MPETRLPALLILGKLAGIRELMLLYTAALAQEESRELDLHQEEVQDAHYRSTLGT